MTAGFFAAILLSSCYSPAKYCVGNYHINVGKATDKTLREEVRRIATQIAKELDYDLVVDDDSLPGLEISLHPKASVAGTDAPRIGFGCYSNARWFDIGVFKVGVEENKAVLRARRSIEKILDDHKSFHWAFEFSNSTYAR